MGNKKPTEPTAEEPNRTPPLQEKTPKEVLLERHAFLTNLYETLQVEGISRIGQLESLLSKTAQEIETL